MAKEITPIIGQSNDQAAQSAGYANAEEARKSGVTFAAGVASAELPKKTPVSMLDTESAIAQVNKDKTTLDTIAPIKTGSTYNNMYDSAKYANATSLAERQALEKANKSSEGRAYYVNTDGQEASYTAEQLKDDSVQNFLKNNGYVLQKSEGIAGDTTAQTMQTGVNTIDSQIEDLVNKFNTYNVDSDPAFQSMAQNIRDQYETLRTQTKKLNDQRDKAFKSLGYRTGSTQYAGSVQMGIEGEEFTQATQRLDEINRDEANAISTARQAFETNNFTKFNQQVNALQTIRENKAKELENYNQALADYNKKLSDERSFELEVAKYYSDIDYKNATLAQKEQPMVVSPGASIYNPKTGEFLGTAPEKPTNPMDYIKVVGDKMFQYNPNSNSFSLVYDGTNTNTGTDSLEWAKSISNGTAKLTDVPQDMRSGVITALNSLPPKQEDVSKLNTKIGELDSILKDPGMNSAVGTSFLTRGNKLNWSDKLSGNTQNFIGKVQQLLSEKTLQSLIDAKAQGATFGALSEGELKILQESSTKIGNWAIKDKGGNIVGYNVSEKAFKDEINNIKQQYQELLNKTAGNESTATTPVQKIDQYYINNPDKRDYIDRLEAMGKTPEEQMQILGISFNQVGNTSASTNMTDLQKRNLSYAPEIPNVTVKIGAGAAVKNNNPGNLRNTDGSWMKFSTPEEGFKALAGYIERAKQGDHARYNANQSLYQFFAVYAPSADKNNPKSYAETVAKQLGVSPNTKIGQLNTFNFAKAIAKHESSTKIA